jgi:hypothetical protein
MKEPDDIQSSLAMYQFPVSSSAAQVTPVSVTASQKMSMASAGPSMHHHQIHHQQQQQQQQHHQPQVRIQVQTSSAPLSVPASATVLPKQEQQQRSRLPPLAPAPTLGTTSANTTPPADVKSCRSTASPSRKRSPPEPPTNPTSITLEEITSYISGPSGEDNKYLCLYPDCGKRFGRKENIKSHVQTHLGDRQYKCATCKKCFVRQHDLKRHAKIHTGVKPYPCACGNSFARHDALTRHRQRGMCIGAFEGVVKKVVKRGRPRKKPLEGTAAGQATINANAGNSASSVKLKKESLPRLKLESKSASPAPSSSDSTCPDENHGDDYDGQPPSPLSDIGGERAHSSLSYSTGGNPSTTSFDFASFISPPTSASTSSISLVSSSTTTPGESHHHHPHHQQQQQQHNGSGNRDSVGKSQLNSPLTSPEMMGNMKTVVVTSGFDYPPVSTPTGMGHGHSHHQQHHQISFETVDPLELEGFGVNDSAWGMGSMGWGDGVANWVG